MKKTSVKLLAVLLLFVTLLSCFAIGASAESVHPHVSDPDGLLTGTEAVRVEDAFAELEAATGIPCRAFLYEEGRTYSYFDGDHYRDEIEWESNLYLIVVVLRYSGEVNYDMYTFGKAKRMLTDNEVDEILDDFVVHGRLKSGDFAEGLVAYAEVSMRPLKSNNHAVTAAIVGIILGLIVSLSVTLPIVHKYKKKLKATAYPLDEFTKMEGFTGSERFIGKHVTRTKISSSSSGSHGSSHSGGFGGGGGHRGGR